MKIVIGITGASGCMYGISLLKRISQDHEIHLIITEAAKTVIKSETKYSLDEIERIADYCYPESEIAAPISSGSFQFDAMVVIPCSIKSLSSIANSYAYNLLVRAADVSIKEKRKIIVCVREMPLHEGHLKLMIQLAQLGVVVCPLSPPFYNKPETIEDIFEQINIKIMDLLGISVEGAKRWRGLT